VVAASPAVVSLVPSASIKTPKNNGMVLTSIVSNRGTFAHIGANFHRCVAFVFIIPEIEPTIA
jgi:hypothetical protein